MSTRTMRHALVLNKDRVVSWVITSAFFVAAAFAVTETLGNPPTLALPQAAEAVSTPVNASLPNAAPAAAAWGLANIANPRVDNWVKRFTTTLKNDFTASLNRGESYIPMITAKLAERNMPQELAYLPLIESEYKNTARSPVSAVGMWQFMSSTARKFGLSVGHKVDERKDPAKATDAALTYLSELHDQFGSWYLAAAAYNAGPGTIQSAMKRTLGRSTGTDEDFYAISKRLPAETREYVPKLIAAATIGKNPGQYGLTD